MTTIAARIRAARERRKFSQAHAAKSVGMSPGRWHEYEVKGVAPGADALRDIAMALGVSADFLLGIKPPPKGAGRRAKA